MNKNPLLILIILILLIFTLYIKPSLPTSGYNKITYDLRKVESNSNPTRVYIEIDTSIETVYNLVQKYNLRNNTTLIGHNYFYANLTKGMIRKLSKEASVIKLDFGGSINSFE